MRRFPMSGLSFVVAIAFSVAAIPCKANLIVLTTNPTGPGSAVSTLTPGGGLSFLNPAAAGYDTQGGTPAGWAETVRMILQHEAYAGTGGAAPTASWTFNMAGAALQGGIQLNVYQAWADQYLGNINGFNANFGPAANFGGAATGLTYAPSTAMGTTDPAATTTEYPGTPAGATGIAAGTYLGFINLVRDNGPSPWEMANGIANGGFTYCVDNPGSGSTGRGMGAPTSPFYNVGGAADATQFADRPANHFSPTFIDQFITFVATDTVTINRGVTNNVVTLYDGVNWGFVLTVPEPDSMILCVIGVGGAGFLAWLRRGKKAATPG